MRRSIAESRNAQGGFERYSDVASASASFDVTAVKLPHGAAAAANGNSAAKGNPAATTAGDAEVGGTARKRRVYEGRRKKRRNPKAADDSTDKGDSGEKLD